jgi:hypothetical protein
MDLYALEKIAYEKIAEDRKAAAHDRLAVQADQARRTARQAARSPFVAILRTLGSVFGFRRPALESTVSAGHAQ